MVERIVNLFALATGAHHPLSTQDAELLRERGLTDTRKGFKVSDIGLTLRQLAEQHESVFIGEKAKE
jgi:hypothetical protein